MTGWFALAALLASALAASRLAVRALHMWQMDSYINSRYIQWLFAKPFERYVDATAVALAMMLPIVAMLAPPEGVLAVWTGWALWIAFRPDHTPVKKPLDYTERARRTLWTARVLLLAAAGAAWLLPWPAAIPISLLIIHAGPWAILGANQLLRPLQAARNRGFVRAAKARLGELKPVVIGVAGSYGKTSTKYFLDVLLSEKYRVLKSPGNYNTLLGITRVINDMLQPEHEVLIAEMGAYQRGEVKEIADLASPRMGIITSIGPEHFERFLSMENIEQTNYELIAALPATGLGVFNGANEHCRKLAAATVHTRAALYTLTPGDGDLWAEDIVHTREGLRFTIATNDGRRAQAATSIVGRHNVLNILGAARLAMEMGVTLEEIVRGIAKLRAAPNRLEVKPGAGGTTIIDDSYNSNPIGFAEALEVLSEFRGGKRILITPGMIELGVLQHQENEKIGRLAARCCDVAILVGPEQTKPVQDGLRAAGFPTANLHVVRDLAEATALFPRLLRPGDVLLFENDLPDLYAE